jgi:uncharacterized DUF497 family protein
MDESQWPGREPGGLCTVHLSHMHKWMYLDWMEIEWDPEKAAANLRKHGIPLSYAADVLEDEYALTREDPHAQREQRFVTVGLDGLGRMLTVVYTHRGERIRCISARRATRREREAYERERP